ncbi:MAG: hypothetical protein PHD04_00955 [Candidatus Pacebacteria bacterium]|nr:hypothetical protein [Candidatus Paceibacterota bacterium]
MHTQGTWIAKEGMIYSQHIGETIAYCRGEANAAFIVRACNNHEALLEALREMFKYALAEDWNKKTGHHLVMQQARAAIAAAEGKRGG